MKQIRETYKKTGRLHHAYGICGKKEKVKEEIFSFLDKDLKFDTDNNPDFWFGEFNVFKVNDSRLVIEKHLNIPIKYEQKVFIIFTNFITKEAQNALLKIFEEPQASTIFFLVMPSVSDLLPTLRSRLIFGSGGVNKKGSVKSKIIEAEDFLKLNVGKRLEFVTKVVKDIKSETLLKSDVIDFLKSLEKEIHSNSKSTNSYTKKNKSLLAIEDIEKAISYASDESPSIKVILEHLSLVL